MSPFEIMHHGHTWILNSTTYEPANHVKFANFVLLAVGEEGKT